MTPGKAAAAATKQFFLKHPDVDSRELGSTGLSTSPVGFGGYRVDIGVSEHRESFRHAVRSGVNLIDTSSNYSDGGSEELFGEVIGELVDSGGARREELIVVTKAGYLQGQNYEISQIRKAKAIPFPDLVEFDDGLEHCIHPDFLEDQIERSLARLDLDCIDLFLLHNPEYYLSSARINQQELQYARQEYYRRIQLAFTYLEKEVRRGRIQHYGVSSNTFPADGSQFEFTSLAELLRIATNLGDHHFAVIQLPMNLYEPGGITVNNQQQKTKSVLELANEHNVGVLVNRPLNAIIDGSLTRLAETTQESSATEEEVNNAIGALIDVEQKIQRAVSHQLEMSTSERGAIDQLLVMGATLQSNWTKIKDSDQWNYILQHSILPTVHQGMPYLARRMGEAPLLATNYEPLINSLNRVLDEIAAYFIGKAGHAAGAIKSKLTKLDLFDANHTLSQMAVRALRSTKGIDCVLVGMRSIRYVDDVTQDLKRSTKVDLCSAEWRLIEQALS